VPGIEALHGTLEEKADTLPHLIGPYTFFAKDMPEMPKAPINFNLLENKEY
jgi:hypothetical protein